LLNTDRSTIIEDWDGNSMADRAFDDPEIYAAYLKHLQYLIDQFEPTYLIAVMEANDLLVQAPEKWEGYQSLIQKLRPELKSLYPDLKISESITLHNFYEPEVPDQAAFVESISTYMREMDFAAISFYPFFKGLSKEKQFQKAFDFLHAQTNLPIAFVETNHLVETLEVEAFELTIESDVCEQQAYLEQLMLNAFDHPYEFIIWWAHRDFDALWETFPEEVKDVGKLWRDTGLLDESGEKRPAFEAWEKVLAK
ncbi:MAG: hypothetical protein AAFV07_15025, partial [Bacteroidota bacterium]